MAVTCPKLAEPAHAAPVQATQSRNRGRGGVNTPQSSLFRHFIGNPGGRRLFRLPTNDRDWALAEALPPIGDEQIGRLLAESAADTRPHQGKPSTWGCQVLVRIRDNWVYGGFLAALMLLALTPVLAASWPLPLLLIWVQLPVYMLHQYEEHDGDRFRLFINAHIGGGREVLSPFAVFVINIAGVWGVDAAAFVLASEIRVGLGLIAVYLSLINGVSHCVMAIAMRRYNPGLITSVLLFIPLGIATLAILARGAPISAVDQAVSVAAALLIHAGIVALIFLRRTQFSVRKI